MLDLVEQRMASTLPAVATKSVIEGLKEKDSMVQMRLFVKVLSNFLQQPTPYVSTDLDAIMEKSEITADELQEQVMALFNHMVSAGSNTTKSVTRYTTGQLAAFFGVTVVTINNWLKVGKIIGAHKTGANKQYRIPETAIYKSMSGESIPISEIVKLYEEEKRRTSLRSMTPTQEQKELLDAVVFFENKYGGVYEKTLGHRDRKALTSLEKRDANEWEYLLRCINGEHE
ncbi:hypothetical protein [Paenibacillus periandrae]|uniref:hypothetical protein n=1 Tax=Paenibacillus periandrae TaxID=1761741 RepID=UPI001F09EAB4|nr:hypothetical protein [Paenibacillus periandrae]